MSSFKIKKIDIGFSLVEIHENYLISQIKEGVTMEQEHLDMFYELFELYFHEKPFVSIADRKYDYTINPNIFRDSPFDNLLGIGIVCYSQASYETVLFEQKFFNGLFKPFNTMEECISWAENLLINYNN
jgi:hypothetical protein